MSDLGAWDRRTADLLEDAYLAGGAGPRGSGSWSSDEGDWRAKRQHLGVPMDHDGAWLDVGCANGHLLATLPAWVAERGVTVEPHGLELLPRVADLARRLLPHLADRIWTGSCMTWAPPRPFDYLTVLHDAVPPDRLADLVARLRGWLAPGGRLIVSSYTNHGDEPVDLAGELAGVGHPPAGRIWIDRPGSRPLQTCWLEAP